MISVKVVAHETLFPDHSLLADSYNKLFIKTAS